MPRFAITRTRNKSGHKGAVVPAMQPNSVPAQASTEGMSVNEARIHAERTKRRTIDEALAPAPVVKADGNLEQGRGEKAVERKPARKKIQKGPDGRVEVTGMENARAVVSDDIVADPLGVADGLGEDQNGEEIVEDTETDDEEDSELEEIAARHAALRLEQEQREAAEAAECESDETPPPPADDPPPPPAVETFSCRFPGCVRPPFGSAKGRNAHEKSSHDGFVPPEA